VKKTLQIIVKDSGIGIPARDIPYLFESFYRGANSNNIPGSGLGLSILQRKVEMQNGLIEISSVENKGTIVKIDISIESDRKNKS
jgi:signal transduction histidine kinase